MQHFDHPPILFLDTFPESRIEKLKVLTKVIVKEGIWLWDWDGVSRARRGFGSVRIPNTLLGTLKTLGVNLIHNVYSTPRAGSTAVVIKDLHALQWAMQQKRAGRIKRLIVGPFIATLPTEYSEILLSSEIDALIFLSEWHRDLFCKLARKSTPEPKVWFAGVDAGWWTPGEKNRIKILVYKKMISEAIFRVVLELIREAKLPYSVLEYGRYSPEVFRSELQESRFAIFLSKTETQGIASFEAWSCDVPTLHNDPGVMTFQRRDYGGASSCPYLSSQTGMRFTDETELREQFGRMLVQCRQLKPRAHVLERYTKKHSARRFISILEDVIGTDGHLRRGESHEKEQSF